MSATVFSLLRVTSSYKMLGVCASGSMNMYGICNHFEPTEQGVWLHNAGVVQFVPNLHLTCAGISEALLCKPQQEAPSVSVRTSSLKKRGRVSLLHLTLPRMLANRLWTLSTCSRPCSSSPMAWPGASWPKLAATQPSCWKRLISTFDANLE